MSAVKRSKTMPADGQTAKFLYTILKQLDLKIVSRNSLLELEMNTNSPDQIDWNQVASQLEITNGHAARMRFSRFKQHMEGSSTASRTARPKKPKADKAKSKKAMIEGLSPAAPVPAPALTSTSTLTSGPASLANNPSGNFIPTPNSEFSPLIKQETNINPEFAPLIKQETGISPEFPPMIKQEANIKPEPGFDISLYPYPDLSMLPDLNEPQFDPVQNPFYDLTTVAPADLMLAYPGLQPTPMGYSCPPIGENWAHVKPERVEEEEVVMSDVGDFIKQEYHVVI
ncbi:hypothetical protein FQN57_003319 [Myotisia sp. PD_48]|nr:hypothetical protein FQN57_003319 [Myotisia sp. PD_48]